MRLETPALSWNVETTVPFSWRAWSKNRMWLPRGRSARKRLSPQAQGARDELQLRLQERMRQAGVRVEPGVPIWVLIRVGRPDMRGDPVNCVDLVCDAVQAATGVDDRWTKLLGLDWEVSSEGGWLEVCVGQAISSVSVPIVEGVVELRAVMSAVAAEFGVPEEALTGRGQLQRLARARHAGMWLARECCEATLEEIGRMFHRDFSTVHYALERVRSAMKHDAGYRSRMEGLRARLLGGGGR